MKRYLSLLLCLATAGCIRSLFRQPVAVEDDRSIVFPQFFERAPVEVGVPGQPYQLDGVTLRAIAIAANDFLPPGGASAPCVDRQEAHVYRVIRRSEIVFVRIDENPEYCGRKYGGLDSGAKYAISTDGRILRRILDGMEEYTGPADGSTPVPGEPGVSPSFDPEHLQPLPFMHPSPGDGGTPGAPLAAPPGGSTTDGGSPLQP
ncbi:MAG: hypothetical protein ACXU86_10345 [Archangium sp.]